MKKLTFGLAALPFMAGIAMAAQPVALSDTQLDKVTAGNCPLCAAAQNPTTTLIVVSGSPAVGGAVTVIEQLSFPPNGPAGPFAVEFYEPLPPLGSNSAQIPPATLGLVTLGLSF